MVEQSLDDEMMNVLKDRVSVGSILEKESADRLELETEQLSGKKTNQNNVFALRSQI